MTRSVKGERILALDPMSRDLGFAVLEGNQLVGWGVKILRRKPTLAVVRRLIADYQPTVLVIPDAKTARHPHRRRSLRRFIMAIEPALASPAPSVITCSAAKVRAHFMPLGARTKQQIAELLTKQFPELRPWLPKKRPFYEKEDPHFGIFDALAMALATLESVVPGERPQRTQ